jgi:hypothetical protein
VINKYYRDAAIEKYGHACEICGHSIVEVHHINYQEHGNIEKQIRAAEKSGNKNAISSLIENAKYMGFVEYKNGQLSKDDHVGNLSVLCGNCHSLIHLMDVGLKLLKALKGRK